MENGYPVLELFLSQETSAQSSRMFFSPRQYFLTLPNGVELGSYPLLELLLSQKNSCTLQLLVFVSPRQHFWRLPSGMKLGSYPLLSCYCHKKILHRAVANCCISWSLLLETPNRVGIGQLSPNRAFAVTKSSGAEQSQVFISSRLYFMSPQPGWSRATTPIRAVIVSRNSCTE